jgi:hypothetical protein
LPGGCPGHQPEATGAGPMSAAMSSAAAQFLRIHGGMRPSEASRVRAHTARFGTWFLGILL